MDATVGADYLARIGVLTPFYRLCAAGSIQVLGFLLLQSFGRFGGLPPKNLSSLVVGVSSLVAGRHREWHGGLNRDGRAGLGKHDCSRLFI